MKRFMLIGGAILIMVLFAAVMASAEVPGLMNYQGRLTDPSGTPLNATIPMIFTIYDAATGGNPLWTETHSAVEVTNGLFNVILGSVTDRYPFDVTISDGENYLSVKVGEDPEIVPRTRLTSAPYAFHAAYVDGFRSGPDNVNSGQYTVVAGDSNTVMNDYSSIIGGVHNTVDVMYTTDTIITESASFTRGTNASRDGFGAIGGGINCNALGNGSGIFWGLNNTTNGAWSFIGGGFRNTATGHFSTIPGGHSNRVGTGATPTGPDGRLSAIGGGYQNTIAGNCSGLSVIGGGHGNTIEAAYSVIAGGSRTTFSDPSTGNTVYDKFSVISGGGNNKAGTDNGDCNDAPFATISGGRDHWAGRLLSTIGGGYLNQVTGDTGTIAGGAENRAIGWASSIGGGSKNETGGPWSVIPGGSENVTDGEYSFAAGYQAAAWYNNGFVWNDGSVGQWGTTDHNQFLIHSLNGVGINVDDPSEDLDIEGQIRIRGGGPAAGYVLTSATDGTGSWQPATGAPDADWDITTYPNHMVSMPSGNVGIGTATPGAKLHINGTTLFSGVATIETGTWLRSQSNGGARISGGQGSTPASPAIGFFTTGSMEDGGGGNGIYRPMANTMAFATGSIERMRLSVNGYLGIGTNNPKSALDAYTSTGYNQLRMQTSYTPSGSGDSNGNVGDMAWDDNFIYIKTAGAGWKRAALTVF